MYKQLIQRTTGIPIDFLRNEAPSHTLVTQVTNDNLAILQRIHSLDTRGLQNVLQQLSVEYRRTLNR